MLNQRIGGTKCACISSTVTVRISSLKMCEDKLFRAIGDAVYPVYLFGRCLVQQPSFFCRYVAVPDRCSFVKCNIKTFEGDVSHRIGNKTGLL
jgi:hypothetical protein